MNDKKFGKYLVLTGTAPGDGGVGAILIKQILDQLPRDQVRVVVLKPRTESTQPDMPNPVVHKILFRRYEPAYRPAGGLVGEITSALAQQTLGFSHLQNLIKKCVDANAEFSCNAVLSVLDCPTLIRISASVSKALQVPLYSFVMDDPEVFAQDFGFGPTLRNELNRSFDRTMRTSERLAVAGESMQQAYFEKWGKRGRILRQGLQYEPLRPGRTFRVDSPVLRIAFAGSMTARDAFDQLVRSLDQRNWEIAGKKVILRIIGAHLKLVPTGPQHIEYFGWRSIPDMISLCEECDVLYLPQSFDQSLRKLSQLSFPNKLCTYLPARRPIALHSPPGSSMHSFFEKYPCGPVSSELEASDLLRQVESLVLDSGKYESCMHAIEDAFRHEINLNRLKEEISEFLS